MILSPADMAKVVVECAKTDLGAAAVIDQRADTPAKLSYVRIVVGNTTFEIDHVDGTDNVRTADQIGAIAKALLDKLGGVR